MSFKGGACNAWYALSLTLSAFLSTDYCAVALCVVHVCDANSPAGQYSCCYGSCGCNFWFVNCTPPTPTPKYRLCFVCFINPVLVLCCVVLYQSRRFNHVGVGSILLLDVWCGFIRVQWIDGLFLVHCRPLFWFGRGLMCSLSRRSVLRCWMERLQSVFAGLQQCCGIGRMVPPHSQHSIVMFVEITVFLWTARRPSAFCTVLPVLRANKIPVPADCVRTVRSVNSLPHTVLRHVPPAVRVPPHRFPVRAVVLRVRRDSTP